MTELPITISKPKECSPELLKIFYDLVVSGGQIPVQYIGNGIKRADFLAYWKTEDEIVGVASIKNPDDNYRVGVFKKAKVEKLANKYDLEIGYAVTKEKFRGQGISPKLILSLMDNTNSTSFYATTKNDNMRKILEKMGFVKVGDNYQNDNKEILSLYTFNKTK